VIKLSETRANRLIKRLMLRGWQWAVAEIKEARAARKNRILTSDEQYCNEQREVRVHLVLACACHLVVIWFVSCVDKQKAE